jgi:hypothetical protein
MSRCVIYISNVMSFVSSPVVRFFFANYIFNVIEAFELNQEYSE